jgi:hypothetical protein
MKVSGKILLFILIFSGFPAVRCGATVYQSNGSAANVQSLNNGASNGDTIMLPAGAFTWTTPVTINKAVTLKGAGVGSTIIKDSVQSLAFLNVTLVAGNLTRITGIEFQDGGRANSVLAALDVHGSNTNGSQFRFDNCKWGNVKGSPRLNTVIGVIDHDTFIIHTVQTAIYVYGSDWDGHGPYGDGSWSVPTGFGTSQFLFIEDCTFISTGPIYENYVTDAYSGARFVVRHCNITNARPTNHGTESTGRHRGARAMEVYKNHFTLNNNKFAGGSRSGSVVFHDNTVGGSWANAAVFDLGNFRNFMSFAPWGGADGTNPWDTNEPNVFFSGTAAANSSGTTVTVSGVNWTANQWKNYTVRRSSNICNSNSVGFGYILSNTSNTITYSDNGGYVVPTLAFCAGDTLEIRKVDHALDQPGRARGSLISPVPNPPRPPGWNDQVTEPCYSWNNGTAKFSGQTGVIEGIHYFNNVIMPGYSEYTYPHPLVTGASRAVVRDFNGDGHPDYVLCNPSTHQTAIWYLNNNVFIGGALGPSITAGWALRGLADFNGDSHSDYALFAPNTNQTALWYLSGPTFIAGAYGPTLPNGWELVGTADCNGDSRPDYVLYNSSTHQTAIWYLNNNVYIGGGFGPTLPNGWRLVGVADFDGDGHPDYVLFHPSTGYTAIVYLSGRTVIGAAWGPTILSNWALVATGDFNGDGHPDYVLYNAGTRQTAIWYLINNVYVGGALGPTIPIGWSLTAP